jgi:hypothetical protein
MTPVPVLLLIFNRPETTAQVMEAISAARPPRLYIAADGPRPDRPAEAAQCEDARRIATAVDWPCEVETLFRETNLGCRQAVSSAIDWFFAREEGGIILEDDCVPAPEFFPYCAELLDKYRDDARVMAICGSCYAAAEPNYHASYSFSYFADIWGWATWRRAWRLYDRDLSRWPAFAADGGRSALPNGWQLHKADWAERFAATRAGQVDTWDYQWIFTVIESGGLVCYPVRNLISNCGFGPNATHTTVESGQFMPQAVNRKHETLTFPLVHPSRLYRSARIERSIEAVRLGFKPPRRLDRIRSWIAKYRGLVKARMPRTAATVGRLRRGAR